MFSRCPESHQTFGLLLKDNLSPKTFKNAQPGHTASIVMIDPRVLTRLDTDSSGTVSEADALDTLNALGHGGQWFVSHLSIF